MAAAYTEEIDEITAWPKQGLSAPRIAGRFSALRGSPVSRNAIIGIVRRNTGLSAIGFVNPKGGRAAGQRFRYDFERAERQGLQPQSWRERVDGGLLGGGIPGRVLSAGRAHVHAAAALAHCEVAVVVRKICLEGQSVKAIAERTGE